MSTIPEPLLSALTLYADVPDDMFILQCDEDATVGMCLVRGRAVIRDFEFSGRWSSVFVTWTNIPSVATFRVDAVPIVVDFFVAHHAGTWRGVRDYFADRAYSSALACAERLKSLSQERLRLS